ncbi:hypothetical protein WC5_04457, partial [Escherichia sp. KTE114]
MLVKMLLDSSVHEVKNVGLG